MIPILSGQQWLVPDVERGLDVFNPSTGEVIGEVPLCDADTARAVVAAAAAAAPQWSQAPVVERARLMFRFREILEREAPALAALITTEHGKTLAEAAAEVRRGIEVVEFACGIPSLIMGRAVANLAPQVDAEVMRHPVGVCVGVTPYNFPAMVPLWMFPIALVCGNTFVLKPSEKTPLTANRLAELLLEAGCPPGVFNVVHGAKECVEALIDAPQVAAVSFVGSTSAARVVYQRATHNGKRAQAAGGAKNHFLVLPDADPEMTVEALIASSLGCAGQRCMASSVAVPIGEAADWLLEGYCRRAAELRVGRTDTPDASAEMGPLIRAEDVARVGGYLDHAIAEGAVVKLDGRRGVPERGFFLRPSLIDHVAPEMRVAREEIFGPVLSVMRASDWDAALELGRLCEFGNGASLFTRDGRAAREFRQHFPAGMLGINVGVPAPMAWFPFTGWNRSFFGDLHVQGLEGIDFYTRQKVTLTKWSDRSFTGVEP